MCPTYEGVKFYSSNDMSIGLALQEAEPILNSFDTSREYSDINAVIELYNIQKLLEAGAALNSWTEEIHNNYCNIAKQFSPVLGRFFGKINESSFEKTQKSVSVGYLEDFWKLFVDFNVYKRISHETMGRYLKLPETSLYMLMIHKELVDYFDAEFAEALRVSDQAVGILVYNFLEDSKRKYYLPKSFTTTEFETVFSQYICSDNINPNILQLIYKAQSTAECPISDKLRLEAKRSCEKYWNTRSKNIIKAECGITVSFQDQNELKIFDKQGESVHISYDVKWLEASLEYSLILYNFRYVFEMLDYEGRSTLVSVKSKISAIEDAFSVKGVKFYKRGVLFNEIDICSRAQMEIYNTFLLEHGIYLEDVFKWFFEKYLPDEFGVDGFRMNTSLATATYIEKCRNLAAEMEGVLKQFRMFVRDGIVDRELFEISSEQMVMGNIPSLIEKKYAYAASDEIKREMYALFSDQALLGYTQKTKSQYPTLFQLLDQEDIQQSDFAPFQTPSINWLADRGSIQIDNHGSVKLSSPRAIILKDLYDHDVMCLPLLINWKPQIESMISAGDLKIGTTLFSQPESDYLNYELNKSQFSDGLNLRNKYAHSTYPADENEQKNDYIQLLKLMVLVISKINDEFCMWQDSKEVSL